MKFEMNPGDRVGEGGRYEIEKLLGAGAFGEVFRARDKKLDDRPVAIKRLMPHVRAQRDTWQRFRQEVKILAKLAHPNIIGIYDFDEAQGVIVLEYAANGTLENVMSKTPRMPVHQALEVAISVLDALSAVHNECIWHRDLKPANILLDAAGRVKVSDFGIAHAPDGSSIKLVETKHGQPGTPLYMSPEQIEGVPIDGRSDVWAVGVILYQLLTGFFHLPFWTLDEVAPAQQFSKLKELITTRKARAPSLANPQLPSMIDAPILRALAISPDERYSEAKEMLAALKKLAKKIPDPNDASALPPAPAETTPQPRERVARAHVVERAAPEPEESGRAVSPPASTPEVVSTPAPVDEPISAPYEEPPLSSSDGELLGRAKELGTANPAAVVTLLKARAEATDVPSAILLYLAEAHAQLRAYPTALAVAARGCTVRGAPPECWLVRGMCLGRLGRAKEAIAAYREGCMRHATSAPLREALAVSLKNDGRSEEALRVLQEAAVLDPGRPSIKRLVKAWGGSS